MDKLIEKRIDELLSQMTLKEKIGQLHMECSPTNEADFEKAAEKLRRGEIGSMILANSATAGNDTQVDVDTALCNRVQRVAVEEGPHGIPIIYGRDVIHGHRTVYPVPLAMAAAFNDELIKKVYRFTALESSSDGIHWTFAPMLDMCRDPRYGRIIEGPGEDPTVGRRMARAIVEGFQNGNVANEDSLVTCAKHFIGYGASEGGRDYYRTEISPYSLYNYYLPAFREAINAGSDTVMCSFNDINGEPVAGSRFYMQDILRGYLGFDGTVVSDWGAVVFLINQCVAEDRARAAELALNAGVEIDMVDEVYSDTLEQLVNEGRVSMEALDNAVRLVLRLKFKKKLFEKPYTNVKRIDRTEHIKLAREVAGECMLLLKNENKLLPLCKNQKIALLGPFVHEKRALLGSWALEGKAEETPSLYERMVEAVGEEKLIISADPTGLYDDSVRAMYNADIVVLALGESHAVTGERRSLSDISLSASQIELIKKAKYSGKKIVGVIFCGRPIALEGVADLLDAVVYAWHSGTETAAAACDILFGDVNPSGKTAISFPRRVGQIPIYYNASKDRHNGYYGDKCEYNYEDLLGTPYYPFGFGLSYTEFDYSEVTLSKNEISISDLENGEKIKATVKVSNVGDRDGKETVQLYIRDMVSSLMRPYRELKNYKKPFIKAGECVSVQFEIGYNDLGYYLPNGDYTIEKGEMEIIIGANCTTDNKLLLNIID